MGPARNGKVMKTIRIIPRFDIKGPNLVKGVQLEGLRTLGKPDQFAQMYYHDGADELLYMDVVASLYGRNSLESFITHTAKEIFIPLTVGGGLRSLQDIQKVLHAGADKVALNTAAVNRPELIKEASREFGSSTILVSIEALKLAEGKYEVLVENGREKTGVDVFDWARQAADLGAGEILVTSINREGTGEGFDIPLVRTIAQSVSIPVIAGGGAGRLEDIAEVIIDGKADAVSIASILHYHYVQRIAVDQNAFEEGNMEFLKHRKTSKKIDGASLEEIKNFLFQKNIHVAFA